MFYSAFVRSFDSSFGKVLEHIIKIASNENDVVLDMFMGVGSTGVAALNLNRRFIGIELDKEYYDASVKRITKTYNELPKFDNIKIECCA